MMGKFIVIEGIDRCGKDTQIDILLTKIPGAQKINFPNEQIESGKKCRQYLQKKLELSDQDANKLFALNRKETQSQILNLLQNGTTVLCSRYAFSGAAYTASKGRISLQDACFDDAGLLIPNLTILFVTNVDNIKDRFDSQERYENENTQNIVQQNFLKIKDMKNVGQWAVVEVTTVDETAKNVEKAILQMQSVVEQRFGLFQ